ncbi:MAG: cytochrome c oxidase subunit 3 [Chitinophagales bacterium]|nr:cytochrome c oxidase subunit 3 [Chitinophagales bacterium]
MTAELNNQNRFHPLKFAMWIAIASMIMMFAALTSAFIVSEAAGKWGRLPLPQIFWVNTLIIICSSIVMHWTVRAFKKFDRRSYRMGLAITFCLGTLFLIGQFIGWSQMPSFTQGFSKEGFSDFVFAISSVHAAHIIGGLVILLIALVTSFVKPFNPNKLVTLQIIAIYWHFVDLLWIYLFIFFQINLS